ncbi:MAG: metal-binding protein [Methylobacteriaceae bacterium]|nr:metal-binding protein [Methylobacteriaceae bacterium]
MSAKLYRLIGADGKIYFSEKPGTLGGHKRLKLYGRLDCESARKYVAFGTYQKSRVFFADETNAIAAGYKPCARCLPAKRKTGNARARAGSS